jgi:hypothetical protein
MITLNTMVERYNSLAKQPGAPVALESFGLTPDETEKLFNALDEDYHISRHLRFSKGEGRSYRVSGEQVTHVSMDGAIASLL